jgi:hypothetical protein
LVKGSELYLTSSDFPAWSVPRLAVVERVCPDGALEIRVDPPVIGQSFGFGEDLTRVVITPRFVGDDLTTEVELPAYVRVFVPLPDGTTSYAAWAELVATRSEAERIHERAGTR